MTDPETVPHKWDLYYSLVINLNELLRTLIFKTNWVLLLFSFFENWSWLSVVLDSDDLVLMFLKMTVSHPQPSFDKFISITEA